MGAFETILLTTDFSDLSRQAVAPALSIADRFGSKILVLYVVEDRLPPFVVHGATAPALEVLAGSSGLGFDVIENRAQARAVEAHLVHARHDLGCVEAEEVENGGPDIHHVGVLVP